MIRKFEHGYLCLRNNDVNIVNIYPRNNICYVYRYAIANIENQVFVETNPLLAPRVLADWSYNE